MQRLLASAVLTLLALGASAYQTDPLTGDLATAKWEVSPSPGAPMITLNGTVEQVYAKLLELNPNYDEDWAGVDEDDNWHIKQGIKYLRKVKGKPTHLPGQCGQVICSEDPGIYWCSFDPKRTKVLPSYNNIADGAQVILDNCKCTQNGVRRTLGHDGLWAVIVQMAKC